MKKERKRENAIELGFSKKKKKKMEEESIAA